MDVSIPLSSLCYFILGLAGLIALVFLSIALYKLIKFIDKVNNMLSTNEGNISKSVANVKEITDNVKDISDVAIETTASAIATKENIEGYLTTIKDIILILRNIFLKK